MQSHRGLAELIAQRESPSAAIDGRAADVWALGCTLYAILMGELPFHEASEETSAEYRGRYIMQIAPCCVRWCGSA